LLSGEKNESTKSEETPSREGGFHCHEYKHHADFLIRYNEECNCTITTCINLVVSRSDVPPSSHETKIDGFLPEANKVKMDL
jgi:hypothetical protein